MGKIKSKREKGKVETERRFSLRKRKEDKEKGEGGWMEAES